jgi:hypothetical protein
LRKCWNVCWKRNLFFLPAADPDLHARYPAQGEVCERSSPDCVISKGWLFFSIRPSIYTVVGESSSQLTISPFTLNGYLTRVKQSQQRHPAPALHLHRSFGQSSARCPVHRIRASVVYRTQLAPATAPLPTTTRRRGRRRAAVSITRAALLHKSRMSGAARANGADGARRVARGVSE